MLALEVACPKCDAPKGSPCRGMTFFVSRRRYPHPERRMAAEMARASAPMDPRTADLDGP